MKKQFAKLLILFIIPILFNAVNIQCVQAADTVDSVMGGVSNFVKDGENSVNNAINQTGVKNASNFIYNVLLGIGLVAAVAIGSVLGIKFMVSSVEEQAKIKELLVPYVVSCVVVFGAFGIWKIAVNIFKAF